MDDRDQQPETSKAGAKGMSRLLAAQALCKPSIAAIHHPSSTLIYPHGLSGHVHNSFSSNRAPRSLPTPQILTPGRALDISPCGKWTTIFHPNPPLPNQVVEGGTLAIYPSVALLSPVLKNQGGVAPLASFPLISDILGIQYLYPPRQYIPGDNKRSKSRGPFPSKDYSAENGPALVILLPTSLILLHPQQTNPTVPAQPANKGYMIGMLTCPLHTRWHASPGGSMPPDTGWKVERGWMGLVGGEEGVWVGWERKGERGVIRAEVGVKGGVPWMRTTPMSTLPSSSRSLLDSETESTRSDLCQGMVFHESPSSVGMTESTNEEDVKPDVDRNEGQRRIVAVIIIMNDLNADGLGGHTPQARLDIYGFEHRQVELVDGFNDISGGTTDPETIPKSWDWFTLPSALSSTLFPPHTSILSLTPLPHIPPNTLALALLSSGSSIDLVHLDLCSPDKQWRMLGEGVTLDIPIMGEVQLVPSQSVQRGLRGLVAVVSRENGVKLVVMPPVPSGTERQNIEAGEDKESDMKVDIEFGRDGMDSMVDDAARGVMLAVKQEVGYDDIVRAVFAVTPKDQHKDLARELLAKAFEFFEEDLKVDENLEIHRLQVSLFSHIRDERLSVAAELVKLYEASHLFDTCAIPHPDSNTTGEITFHVDTVWSLLFIAEWAINILARLFRSVIIYKGTLSWTSTTLALSAPTPPISLLHIFHPALRTLLIRLLSQINTLKGFVAGLEEPILQPESRFMPLGTKRDGRATIVARERARALGEGEGLDLRVWGVVLEGIEDPNPSAETSSTLTSSYLSLNPTPLLSLESSIPLILSLPSPSSLFLSDQEDSAVEYDAITFESISSLDQGRGVVKCGKCNWGTMALGREGISGSVGMKEMGLRGWRRWRMEREGGCGCGGSWTAGR